LFTGAHLEQAVAPHRLRRPAAAAALLSVMGFDTVRPGKQACLNLPRSFNVITMF
jgi:hypothetical protein